ncbi:MULTISPECIES: UbiA prenyltransferase family protein [Natronolimnohabitans]|uniref:Geranylgeranylglycerol-phosphate geranylgeranyltransferase n=1 Tax=Natronolimnohabitans innermongolicus JCM 12255 TaxID=1227499 RepID=L9X4X0_9EURY|nr:MULTISPECIES: UbiA family prenyltransferase [Natronolimnohabitans]ELY55633.1 geranylgeranylglycerol-phosphate geranylgeranyltransferase [Natronolimnohabitans innermongolicus JCM 12255]MDQ2050237.1 UbiA family prenyltransferase [Natronolimnohabitans sp. A-GB9]
MSTSSTSDAFRAFVTFNRVTPIRYFAIDVVLFGLPLAITVQDGGLDLTAGIAFASMLLVRGSILTHDDYFDAESDAIEKPYRPIPSGLVTKTQAFWMGAAMLAGGLGLAALVGQSFLAAATLLYVILIADPLVFNHLDVTGISTLVTVTSISMFSVMGWTVYGGLTAGLVAIFAATWLWDICHDTIGAYLDSDGDRRAGIASLGRDFSRAAVAGTIAVSLTVSMAILLGFFHQGLPSIVLPVVLLAGTLVATFSFGRNRVGPTTVRHAVEWYVVGSYAWLGLFYLVDVPL